MDELDIRSPDDLQLEISEAILEEVRTIKTYIGWFFFIIIASILFFLFG